LSRANSPARLGTRNKVIVDSRWPCRNTRITSR
jgi:hypothetical protein